MIGAILTAIYRFTMLQRLVKTDWVQDRIMYAKVMYDSQPPKVKVAVGLAVLLLVGWILFA